MNTHRRENHFCAVGELQFWRYLEVRIRIGCKQVVDVVRHIGARLLRAIVLLLQ